MIQVEMGYLRSIFLNLEELQEKCGARDGAQR